MSLKIIVYSHHSLLLKTCYYYYGDWSKCVDVLCEEKGSCPYEINFSYLLVRGHSALETLIWTVQSFCTLDA